jgi:hypothetical protein
MSALVASYTLRAAACLACSFLRRSASARFSLARSRSGSLIKEAGTSRRPVLTMVHSTAAIVYELIRGTRQFAWHWSSFGRHSGIGMLDHHASPDVPDGHLPNSHLTIGRDAPPYADREGSVGEGAVERSRTRMPRSSSGSPSPPAVPALSAIAVWSMSRTAAAGMWVFAASSR